MRFAMGDGLETSLDRGFSCNCISLLVFVNYLIKMLLSGQGEL